MTVVKPRFCSVFWNFSDPVSTAQNSKTKRPAALLENLILKLPRSHRRLKLRQKPKSNLKPLTISFCICDCSEVIQAMPMGKFLDGFFFVGAQFNPIGLTDGEIGLFTAVLVFSPCRQGLTDSKLISTIQGLYQQALFSLIKQNHSGECRRRQFFLSYALLPLISAPTVRFFILLLLFFARGVFEFSVRVCVACRVHDFCGLSSCSCFFF